MLVFSSLMRDAPARRTIEATFRRALAARHSTGITLAFEYFDPVRREQVAYTSALADYMAVKYGADPPDLIFCIGSWTRPFVVSHLEDIAPGARIVYAGWTGERPGPQYAGVQESIDLPGTLELALQLQPRTREVVLVSGASASDSSYVDLAKRTLVGFESRVRLTYLEPLSMPEIERRVARLRENQIVLFLTARTDGARSTFIGPESVERVAAAASVPVYGWYETMIGSGIVGGRMYRVEEVAERAAAIAARLLAGEAAASIPIDTVRPDQVIVDWRALRRWRLDAARLPAGSEVRFGEVTPWERYPWRVAGVLLLFTLMSALVAALLVQRRMRRLAELAVRQSETALRKSHQQVQDLAARLVRAQESERAHLARELHDDINQRLAGISIGLSSLCAAVPASGPSLRASIERLQCHTQELVTTVRVLSHQLHPGVLRHAGLVAALRGLCVEATALHGIRTDFNASASFAGLSEDTALALYRITQEALQNVVRHASASQARVALWIENDELVLSINDDGSGFDAATPATAGLGLISIEERAQLLGGRHVIEAVPGKGTNVIVRLPAHFEPPTVERAPPAARPRRPGVQRRGRTERTIPDSSVGQR